MSAALRHYRSRDEDSRRWDGFPFRPGDIVISTRSKHGTTWMQMICALLIHQTANLPAPLATLSPWLDWLGTPRDEVLAALDAQRHRRVIKTHTPLDGLPIDPAVTYIVVVRHPVEAAVSLFHQGGNLDRRRLAELIDGYPVEVPAARADRDAWLRSWITWEGPPERDVDSLRGVLWHLADAWRRRSEANVAMIHYDDLVTDLGGEVQRLANRLGIRVDAARGEELMAAASFPAMRSAADRLAPDPAGILLSRHDFFRKGGIGDGVGALPSSLRAAYRDRVEDLAPPDLAAWIHRDR